MLSDEPADLVAPTDALRPRGDRAMELFELAVALVAVVAALLLATSR
jgi:hypothetical protein